MRFGSVFSGIEAASVAWGPLGWKAGWFAEIDPFAAAVLAHHYPHVPNLGDMTTIARRVLSGEVEAPDLLCGGSPCQAFSVAGLRKSLDDDRGNLTLKFVELADAIDHVRARAGLDPADIFWENVPGVLSTKDNAFGCFLAGLAGEDEPLVPPGPPAKDGRRTWSNAGCVYGPKRAIAWRTLDAQYFGLAQRRRRVFVVASAGDRFDPATVLFEWEGVRRDSAPSREAGEVAAPCVTAGAANGGAAHGSRSGSAKDNLIVPVQAFGGNRTSGSIEVAPALLAQPGSGYKGDFESETFLVQPHRAYKCLGCDRLIDPAWGWGNWCDYCGHERGSSLVQETAHTLRGEGFDASEDGTGRGTPLVPVHCRDVAQTITSNYGKQVDNSDTALGPNVIAFDTTQVTSKANRSNPKPGDPCHPLAAGAHAPAIAFHPTQDPISSTDGTTHGLGCGSSGGQASIAVAVALRGREGGATAEMGDEVQNCLRASSGGGDKPYVLTAMQVRRLTPVECERLQGFPDNYTQVPNWNGWRAMDPTETPEQCINEGLEVKQNPKTLKWRVKDVDGPRYKALGNSWATNVVHWLGRRLAKAKRLEVAA